MLRAIFKLSFGIIH